MTLTCRFILDLHEASTGSLAIQTASEQSSGVASAQWLTTMEAFPGTSYESNVYDAVVGWYRGSSQWDDPGDEFELEVQ